MSFGAVIYAKNVSSLAAFYAALLDEPAVVKTSYATIDAPGFQLVVVQVPDEIAATIELADPPLRRETTPVKIALTVADVAAARVLAPGLGGVVDPAEREWHFAETTVCDGHDPEGNVFQLRQPESA